MCSRTKYPSFADFLRHVASSDPGSREPRIEARNFLLDSGVTDFRAESYCAEGAREGFDNAGAWLGHHDDYVDEKVYLRRPQRGGPPKRLDPRKPATCPETCREDDNFTDFGGVDTGLHLLRVLDLGDMLKRSSRVLRGPENQLSRVVEAAAEVARHWPDATRADGEALALIEGLLRAWNGVADLRPSYAGFLAEHEELLGASPGEAADGWADRLRDRLVPTYHAQYAIAGLRGFPSAGAPGGGFRRDVARGAVRLAQAFYRLSQEKVLGLKAAKEEFLNVGFMAYAAFPFAGPWIETLTAELRHLHEPVGPWLARLVPGDSPKLQRVIRERRSGALQLTSRVGDQQLSDWVRRARKIAEALRASDFSAIQDAEKLLAAQRSHAEATGDSDPLVKSLCNFAGNVVKARAAEAIRWADEARQWAPSNPYSWTILFRGLQFRRLYEEALRIGRETVSRFPENVVARTGLGEVLKSRGALEESESIYRETVSRFPNNPYAKSGLESVRRLLAKAGKSIEDDQRLASLEDPERSDSSRNLESDSLADDLFDHVGRERSSLLVSEVREPESVSDKHARASSNEVRLAATIEDVVEAESPEESKQKARIWRGKRRTLLGRARLYRRLAHYGGASQIAPAPTYLEKAEALLEELSSSFPDDPTVLAEKIQVCLDGGRHQEARSLIDTRSDSSLEDVPELLSAQARAEREDARQRKAELNPDNATRLLTPSRQLRRLGAELHPIADLQEGRAYLALRDGQARVDGAVKALGSLQGWVRARLPDEDELRSSRSLDFEPWVSWGLRGSLLESLDVAVPVTAAQLPTIEANLERHRYRLDELEEDVGIRAGAIRVPVLPLHGLGLSG